MLFVVISSLTKVPEGLIPIAEPPINYPKGGSRSKVTSEIHVEPFLMSRFFFAALCTLILMAGKPSDNRFTLGLQYVL